MQAQQQQDDIIANPSLFIKIEKGYSPKWEGNLLAWILTQIRQEHLSLITRIKVIRFVANGEPGVPEYYKFKAHDFNRTSFSKYGRIEAFRKIMIDRFEMSNGGFYELRQYDGDATDEYLHYHEPIDRGVTSLLGNFSSLLQ